MSTEVGISAQQMAAPHDEPMPAISPVDPFKMVDLKGLAKAEPFTGADQDWPEWRFRFEALCGMLGLEKLMTDAAQQGGDLSEDIYPEPDQRRSRLL